LRLATVADAAYHPLLASDLYQLTDFRHIPIP
jgi:hypothetical protein